MKNLESLTIHQFRGLKDVKLDNLGQINVLVGFNNSGKTSVLEAIQLYCNPLDIRVWLTVANQRKKDGSTITTFPIETLKWLFPSSQKPIIIKSRGKLIINKVKVNYKNIEEIAFFDQRNYQKLMIEGIENIQENDIQKSVNVIKLNVEVDLSSFDTVPQEKKISKVFELTSNKKIYPDSNIPKFSTPFISSYSHVIETGLSYLLSEVRRQNFKTNVLELLQQIDPNISDLEILNSPFSGFEVYIQHDKLGLTPVSNLGDGIRRLLYISLIIIQAKGGVLLIDEIESSIHTEALKFSMQWLVKWCKELDIQLFATTHSLEAVDAILEVTEPTADLVFYRLEKKEEYTKVVRHPEERLKRLREELGQEVRW